MSDVNCQYVASLNPDIAGVGVRVGFYIQITLNIILSAFMPEAAAGNVVVTLLNSTVLLMAAFIQEKSGGLNELDIEVLFWLSTGSLFILISHYPVHWGYELPKLQNQESFTRHYFLTRATGQVVAIAYFILYSVWVWAPNNHHIASWQDLTGAGCSFNEMPGDGQETLSKGDVNFVAFYTFLATMVGITRPWDMWSVYRISQSIWKKGNQEDKDPSGGNGTPDNDNVDGSSDKNRTSRNKKKLDNGEDMQEHYKRLCGMKIRILPAITRARISLGVLNIFQFQIIWFIETDIAESNIQAEGNMWNYGQITALSFAIMQAIFSIIQFVLKWHMKKEKVQGSQETATDSGCRFVSEGCDYSETSAEGFPTDVEKVGEIEEGNAIQVSRPRWLNEMENKHVFIVLAGNGSRMWRGAFFVPSRDPALSFSPQPPPHSLLRESLPNAKLETAEREMSLDFKAAAQSLATLFKSSKQSVKHAHDAGYAVCLQDMLQIIQSGVSEDSGVGGVARVMDWAEGQLERYREGQEFEKVDKVMAGLPRRQVRDASSPRRASSSTLPDLPLFDTTASKRRHGAITSVETRRRLRASPLPGEMDVRTSRKVKKAGLFSLCSQPTDERCTPSSGQGH